MKRLGRLDQISLQKWELLWEGRRWNK